MAALATAADSAGLEAVSIVELDVNGDELVVWTYPGVEEELEPILVARSGLKAGTSAPTGYSRFKATWHYWATIKSGLPNTHLPKVTAFSLHVVSRQFNPEKFCGLAQLLAQSYLATGEPTKVLEGYLGVFATGETRGWRAAEFDPKLALVQGTALAVLPRVFGQETVIIWNAMLLKKRIVVYCEKPDDLAQVVRAMPQLVWHRQDWSILRPFVSGSEAEISDMSEAGVFVAGVTSADLKSRADLYDVFVDVGGRSVTVADHAKADFQLGSFHKDMAGVLVAAASAAGASAMTVIKAVATKNKALLDQVKSLSSDGEKVSTDDIRAKSMPPATARFVYAVAVAEGIAKGE